MGKQTVGAHDLDITPLKSFITTSIFTVSTGKKSFTINIFYR